MRKAFGILMITILCISCGGDDDGGTSAERDLTGTWRLTAVETTDVYDFNNNEMSTNNFLNETGNCQSGDNIVINSNGTASWTNSGFPDITGVFQTGQTDILDFTVVCGRPQESTQDWEFLGGVLTLTNASNMDTNFLVQGNTLVLNIRNQELFFSILTDTPVVDQINLVYTKQ